MIQTDSRKVKKGDIFVAIKGLTHDGNKYIDEAIKNGAVKVYKNSNPKELGELAKDYYNDPSSKITVIGVTGTKGKTTTCHLIHHILTNLGYKAGLISTVTVDGFHTTTPDVVTLNEKLHEMVTQGFKYAILEVSSHGIDQGRISGINFKIGVLTNIYPEHLDYHKTFKEYKRVKMSFINSCDIKVISPKKSDLNILPGEFNNINAETALKVIHDLGFKNYDKNIQALRTFKLPEGRLEEIIIGKGLPAGRQGVRIFVDFAHTPDSLEKALLYLKGLKHNRLIAVFGCAGLRDTKKRSKMGRISTQLADVSIFTAEDPRTENILDILRRMRSKAIDNKFLSIPERGEAISYALDIAKENDIVAIFGKGHEKTMCFDVFEHPWSDQDFIKNYLEKQDDLQAVVLAAGKGSRMKSNHPKVLRKIAGRPMLSYTLVSLRKAGITNINLVVSYRKNEVIRYFPSSVVHKFQKNPKGGTADAVMAGISNTKDYENTLVINGDDSAFYTPSTIRDILKSHKKLKATVTFVSLIKNDPHGLGRVVRDKNDKFLAIVEEKDATDEIRKINEVNDGLYVFNDSWLKKNLSNLEKSVVSGELYLTELLKLAVSQGKKVHIYKLPNPDEWQGINTPEELEAAEIKMRKRLNL